MRRGNERFTLKEWVRGDLLWAAPEMEQFDIMNCPKAIVSVGVAIAATIRSATGATFPIVKETARDGESRSPLGLVTALCSDFRTLHMASCLSLADHSERYSTRHDAFNVA